MQCYHGNIWFHLSLNFLKPWTNQCIFLMEMFFLNSVNETVYLLWNLPFFKSVPPDTNFFFFSFLKPWADNGSTDQFMSIVLWPGITHLLPSFSKMHNVEEGPGETPSALRCFFYLIISLLRDRKLKSLSPVPLFAKPWRVTYEASLFIGFSRQGYWSELPFPSPKRHKTPC